MSSADSCDAEVIALDDTADIDEVLAQYPNEQDNDPTATWNLVVENCIYNVDNNKDNE